MSIKIISTEEEKKVFYTGVHKVASVIASTLGASGRTVAISQGYRTDPFVTKDGVTVSRNLITLKDEVENVGAMFVYQAARKTVDAAGDGTTTTAVLLSAILGEGNKVISAGAKPQYVKQGVELAVKAVVDELKKNSEDIGENNNKI